MLTYQDFEAQFVDKFDMNKFKESVGEKFSEEMVLYPMFYRNEVLRRIGDFGRLWDISELKEYPVGSMLHLIDDNIMMNKPIVFVPDVNGWSMTRDPYRKYMLHITTPPDKLWVRDMEEFVLPQQGVTVTVLNFRKRYQSYIRTCRTKEDFPGAVRTQVQSVTSYASLFRARVLGLQRSPRRFKYIWGNVLNQIAQMRDRNHFIPIPVGNRQFDRNQFLRSFQVHDRSTIKFPDDSWYLFCMHLLGFVHSKESPSIFENIPKDMWSKIHFVLYTKTKMLILRLDHLKEFNKESDIIMIRLIKQLNMLAESGMGTSERDFSDAPMVMDTEEDKSLPDELPPEAPFEEKPNVIITHGVTTKPMVSAPSAIQPAVPKETVPASTSTGPTGDGQTEKTGQEEPVKPVKSQPISPEETLAKIRAEQDELTKTLVPIEELAQITIDPKWLEVEDVDVYDEKKQKEQPKNAPEFTTPVTPTDQKIFNTSLVKDVDAKAKEVIESHPELTAAQTKRAETLSQAYKQIVVPGTDQTVEDMMKSTPDESINPNTLDFLADQVDDPSMLTSSVNTFEKDYMDRMFKKDLVSELVSFNKVGMFMKDMQIADTSDSLNNMETYTIKYEDINHKEHTSRFTLPKVDDRGFCKINGTLKVLKKQRVPNPICKVSNIRVTLNSDYNKYLVERNTTVAHSFIFYVDRIIKSSELQAVATLGSFNYNDTRFPYEYTSIARKYSKIVVKPKNNLKQPWYFFFDFYNWETICQDELKLVPDLIKTVRSLGEEVKGTICGISKDFKAAYMKVDGSLVVKDLKEETTVETTTFIDFLCDLVDVTLNSLSEWTDFKLLNKTVPTIFALCYRYGLSHMLNYTKTKYQLFDKGQRFPKRSSDIVIRFADKTLVIPRAPLTNALLFAGLNNYDLKGIDIDAMDSKDIYYELIQSKKISVHNLKGIDNFFDYFVDPITADVLNQMGEPTDPKDLLIRATQLLTTEDHKPAASSTNFRFRSYERISSAVYKVLSRAHATYKHKALGASNKFSIADYEIQQLVTQDQLMENVDLINPINDIKYQCEYSHAGFGGRQSVDTFMVDDRQFPEDGTGIISEATVDSSKTAYAGSMSADPTILNMRGMTVSKPASSLKPTQILSPTAVLVPGILQDDK